LALSETGAREFRGLDGHPIPAKTSRVDRFDLGGSTMTDMRFYVASLPVFDAMGLAESGALLGNDFLQRYRIVEFDFGEERIRFGR
jgi:hypothetical protein